MLLISIYMLRDFDVSLSFLSLLFLLQAGSVEGQVVEMGLTTTSLLTAEKFPVVVPNSLFSSQVCLLLLFLCVVSSDFCYIIRFIESGSAMKASLVLIITRITHVFMPQPLISNCLDLHLYNHV